MNGSRSIVPLAQHYQKLDQEDRQNQRPWGGDHKSEIYRINLYTNQNALQADFPSGNSVKAALRRLRKDRPDIHARVLAGEISANAGMVEAGFRKKPSRRKQVRNGSGGPFTL
jgi:hypothetical protein